MAQAGPVSGPSLPLYYRLFFLWIEPVATAVGAYYAQFLQREYMAMTYSSTAAPVLGVSTGESIVLTQLANLYFCFALNEALVLRSTSDLRVWKIFLVGLLIADFGHLYSVKAAGLQVYYEVWNWNAMYWGNVGFVYVGALSRMAFLSGVGLDNRSKGKVKR